MHTKLITKICKIFKIKRISPVVIFAFIFGITGLVALLLVHATSPVINIESEKSIISSPASVCVDNTASNGGCVQFKKASTNIFVTRQATQLYLNGSVYKYIGVNDYPANVRSNCITGKATAGISSDLTDIDTESGGRVKVIRAWFFQHLATVNGVRDWTAFDNTLATAKSHGFKVIATLANEWGSCENNSWTDTSGEGYRDISWYMGGYKDTSLNNLNRNPDSGGITTYRQWLQDVASRYKNDATILAWQLMNEGNAGTYAAGVGNNYPCQNASNGTTPTQAIINWANDVVPLIKSVDSNHLIEIGMSPSSCGTSISGNPSSYVQINGVVGNDLCEFHDYSGGTTSLPSGLSTVINECMSIGKPVNVGEEGINQTTSGMTLQIRASDFNAKFTAQFQAGVTGIEPWVWNAGSGSIDTIYEIKPGDPVLGIMGAHANGQ